MTKEILQIVWSFFATIGFSILFRVPKKYLLVAGIAGALAWTTYLILFYFTKAEALSYFVASIVVGLFAEVAAAIMKCPATLFILGAIIPLVPGAGMYKMMFEAVLGEMTESISIGFQTLTLAGAIAGGLAVASAISRVVIIKRPNFHRNNHKKRI